MVEYETSVTYLVLMVVTEADSESLLKSIQFSAVSYTHLTLPTKRIV